MPWSATTIKRAHAPSLFEQPARVHAPALLIMDKLKPAQAAEELGVNYYTLKRWIREGKIQTVKTLGGHHRIPRSEIERIQLNGTRTDTGSSDAATFPIPIKPHVLVVDDNDDTRELLLVQFVKSGYDVTVAINAREAWDLTLNLGGFDVYVLDNWLPDGSGIDFCQRIRECYPDSLIFFYSAIKTDKDKEMALAAGAQDYILKPHFETLIESIYRHLHSTHEKESVSD